MFYTVEASLITKSVRYHENYVTGFALWEKAKSAYVGDDNYEQAVLNTIQSITDEFANDYLAANPKK